MGQSTKRGELLVDDRSDGERLDVFIANALGEMSRSGAARLIRERRVSLDGERDLRPSRRVSPGDRFEVDLPEPVDSDVMPEDIPIEIVYQDESYAVINKPAGIVVHPAPGHSEGTVVNAMLHHLDDLSGVGGVLRPGIVHRLDRETSGLMVIAKSDRAHREITGLWHTDAVRKFYLAIVYGSPRPDSGMIDAPIDRHRTDRKKMAVRPEGRDARTSYRTIRSWGEVSLMECELLTGRTHQIRVHLQSIGHPIVGDPVYSGAQWKGIRNPKVRSAVKGMNRQALHASRLELLLPGREPAFFEAEPPVDFYQLRARLEEAAQERN